MHFYIPYAGRNSAVTIFYTIFEKYVDTLKILTGSQIS